MRGFGRVKLENAVDRTGNRSRGAGRTALQASGGVDAVGGGHRAIFLTKDSWSLSDFSRIVISPSALTD